MVQPTGIEPETTAAAPAREPAGDPTRRLPRRDYFIMPLLSGLTLVLLLVVTEVACRVIWSQHLDNPCRVEDPSGVYYRPNCVSRLKFMEGPWIENRYNECGNRNAQSCGPKAPGVFRIVILGSSIVSGWGVPYEQTMVPLTLHGLSQACSAKLEIQNVSTNGNLVYIYRRADEALALNPDLVVLVLSPIDTHGRYDPAGLANRDNPSYRASWGNTTLETGDTRLERILVRGRAMMVAKHFLYQNVGFSIKTFLLHPMDVDYMMTPQPERWKDRLADLDVLIGSMADKVHARGIPFVVLPAVDQAQALLLSSHRSVPGFDPRAFEFELAQIAATHKASALNVYDDFAGTPYNRLFYPYDGHPTGEGYEVLSRGLVRELVASGTIPGCRSAVVSAAQSSTSTQNH